MQLQLNILLPSFSHLLVLHNLLVAPVKNSPVAISTPKQCSNYFSLFLYIGLLWVVHSLLQTILSLLTVTHSLLQIIYSLLKVVRSLLKVIGSLLKVGYRRLQMTDSLLTIARRRLQVTRSKHQFQFSFIQSNISTHFSSTI